ncbi:MAG: hypothetical protein U5S82_23315 [Gammaproteobacteria bacterium]|nr:hypothetical protein [Gammaproteobacteria bacterium]
MPRDTDKDKDTARRSSGPWLTALLLLAAGGTLPAGGEARETMAVLPDQGQYQVSGTTRTRIVSHDGAPALAVPLAPAAARDLLMDTLDRLAIATKASAGEGNTLVTDWVLWRLDAGEGRGLSASLQKTGLFGNLLRERHRFAFEVMPGQGPGTSLIRIADRQRQVEREMAPDSTTSWFEWAPAPTDRATLEAFLRRIQGTLEAAMSSRLVVVDPGAGTTREAVVMDAETPGVTLDAPAPAAAPVAAARRESLRAESPRPAPQASRTVGDGQTPVSAPVPRRPRPQVQDAPRVAANAPNATPLPFAGRSAPAPLREPRLAPPATTASLSTDGLLVYAPPAATWDALLQALQRQGIPVERQDPGQHMLRTGWIDARYDGEAGRLERDEAGGGPRWAFSLFDGGRARQRFQVLVLSANGGQASVVKAYHMDSQRLVDTTPDSSSSRLAWVDEPPSGGAAMALLKSLALRVE